VREMSKKENLCVAGRWTLNIEGARTSCQSVSDDVLSGFCHRGGDVGHKPLHR